MFFSPLALALLIPISEYGQVEASLAMGSLIYPIFGLGLATSVSYFLLKAKNNDIIPLIVFCSAIFGLISLLTYFSLNSFKVDSTSYQFLIFGGIFAVQFTLSAYLKSTNRTFLATVLDGGFYIILMFLCTAFWISSTTNSLKIIEFFSLLYLIILIFFCFIFFFLKNKLVLVEIRTSLYQIFKYSLPFVLPALGMLAIVNGGRVLASNFLSIESVAAYGLLFRLTATSIVFHQLISTIFFRKIYLSPPETLDVYFSCIFITSLSIGFFTFFLLKSDFLISLTFMGTLKPIQATHYPPMIFLTSFWISLALFEPIIAREKLALQHTSILLVTSLIGFLVCFIFQLHGILNLHNLIYIQLFVFFSAYACIYAVFFYYNINLPIFGFLTFSSAFVFITFRTTI
ncbi:MAG: hypothetical protein EVA59_14745 [Limnobacter sp.]|uniref:hypothetical protein n=1 Tax=Limnobacter sp. TaxID=2003368 RepID=UPI0011F7DBFD|nr:hypothetical protein [Limnobacter sp.]MDZ4050804.1 hypothetical protein [Limnobacter sp.]RZO90624.1 MAG: hypothetical protein EVA59_14745 [Limnobacter sp.]